MGGCEFNAEDRDDAPEYTVRYRPFPELQSYGDNLASGLLEVVCPERGTEFVLLIEPTLATGELPQTWPFDLDPRRRVTVDPGPRVGRALPSPAYIGLRREEEGGE